VEKRENPPSIIIALIVAALHVVGLQGGSKSKVNF